jgi:hypothetical protein
MSAAVPGGGLAKDADRILIRTDHLEDNVVHARWHEMDDDGRFPVHLQGASARFVWLKELSGYSHRRIAELVSQRLTVTGRPVKPVFPAAYSVSTGTLNALAKPDPNKPRGNHVRTLAALEVFFETPPGYFRVPQDPAEAPFYQPGPDVSHRDEDEVWLMAARFSELDAEGRAAVKVIMELIRAQNPRPVVISEDGSVGAGQDR